MARSTSPNKYSSEEGERLLSRTIESLRKDIECAFGILKKRWKCLKHPIYLKRKRDVDCIFITCCILSNMLSTLGNTEKTYPVVLESGEESSESPSQSVSFENGISAYPEYNFLCLEEEVDTYVHGEKGLDFACFVSDKQEREKHCDLRRALIDHLRQQEGK
jgi:hypothetical protein